MKKLFIIIAVLACLGTLAFAGFGSATDLDVRGGTIQAGADIDLKLYGMVFVSDWDVNYRTGDAVGLTLKLLSINGTVGEAGCIDVTVVITDESHAGISSGSATLCGSAIVDGAVVPITLNVPVPACEVYDIRVFIDGGKQPGVQEVFCPLP